MPRMGKTEEDWNGLKLGFLKTVQPNSFPELISVVCNFINNAWETYLFVSNLWFCHLHVNFLAYFKFHSDWGRVTGKIKQNELDCRDTAPFTSSPGLLDVPNQTEEKRPGNEVATTFPAHGIAKFILSACSPNVFSSKA